MISETHERVRSLDGLRGIAALIVLLHHSVLSTQLVSGYFSSGHLTLFSGSWWLLETPIGLMFAGTPAVVLFFTLSGFVLTKPSLREGFDWVSFSARRIIRIWLPVAGSLILAATLILFFPQEPADGASAWLNQYSFEEIEPKQFLANFDLLFGPSQYNNPLWSMHFELLFSLTLSAFLILITLVGRFGLMVSVFAFTILAGFGAVVGLSQLVFIPGFAVGVAYAAHVARSGVNSRRPAIEALLWCAGVVLLFIYSFVRLPFGISQFTPGFEWIQSLWIPGSLLLMRSALAFEWFRRLLELTPFQWLGKVSFALYLVHVPLIVAIQHWSGHGLELYALLIVFPVVLLVAELFWRYVDRPSIDLARRAGLYVSTEFQGFRKSKVF